MSERTSRDGHGRPTTVVKSKSSRLNRPLRGTNRGKHGRVITLVRDGSKTQEFFRKYGKIDGIPPVTGPASKTGSGTPRGGRHGVGDEPAADAADRDRLLRSDEV